MPRKWIETVHPWPPLQPGTWYALRVAEIKKSTDPPGLRVHLAFVEGDQAGRVHEAVLTATCRPHAPEPRVRTPPPEFGAALRQSGDSRKCRLA
jgi:hypothetical protein